MRFCAAARCFALGPVFASPLARGASELATISAAETSSVVEVRHRRGSAIAGAIIGGIIGGAIASQGWRAHPAYPYSYYEPYSYYPGGPAIAYCMSRFRSYDPDSMTHLGYDGLRHRCP
jgi:BA14K-like protein